MVCAGLLIAGIGVGFLIIRSAKAKRYSAVDDVSEEEVMAGYEIIGEDFFEDVSEKKREKIATDLKVDIDDLLEHLYCMEPDEIAHIINKYRLADEYRQWVLDMADDDGRDEFLPLTPSSFRKNVKAKPQKKKSTSTTKTSFTPSSIPAALLQSNIKLDAFSEDESTKVQNESTPWENIIAGLPMEEHKEVMSSVAPITFYTMGAKFSEMVSKEMRSTGKAPRMTMEKNNDFLTENLGHEPIRHGHLYIWVLAYNGIPFVIYNSKRGTTIEFPENTAADDITKVGKALTELLFGDLRLSQNQYVINSFERW